MLVSEVQVFPDYFEAYFKSIPSKFPLQKLLENRREEVYNFYDSIPEEKWSYRYAEGKWSIQKLVRHILDAELIFDYRALSFARGELQALAGWSEDEYASIVSEKDLNKTKLLQSLRLQLDYTADLFSNFSTEDLKKIGNANQYNTEVGAIGFAIVAHEIHHRNIIKERYLTI